MRAILTIIITFALAVILIAINEICKTKPNKNNNEILYQGTQDENISLYDNLTNEEEIIILLENIAKNQKKIKTNTNIIIVILLIPIIISILIFITKATVIIAVFQAIEQILITS